MKSLKLWKLNEASGEWLYERNVEPDTQYEWLSHFQRFEPRATFKVSATKPTKKRAPRSRVSASLLGRTAFVKRYVPGTPVGIPSDAMVEVCAATKERAKVSYRGHDYWVDLENLRLP